MFVAQHFTVKEVYNLKCMFLKLLEEGCHYFIVSMQVIPLSTVCEEPTEEK